jgi:hypothetical protein
MGSVCFSPTGNRLVFVRAMGQPDDEQGWEAVTDRTGGTAKLILVGEAVSYHSVHGWLDGQTLSVQSNTIQNLTIGCQLISVTIDVSVVTKVAEGLLLTRIDNHESCNVLQGIKQKVVRK